MTILRKVACVERGKNENATRTLPHPMLITPLITYREPTMNVKLKKRSWLKRVLISPKYFLLQLQIGRKNICFLNRFRSACAFTYLLCRR